MIILFAGVTPAQALSVPKSFLRASSSPYLSKSGIIVIDPTTEQTIFSRQADLLRAPASVLKLVSTTTAVKILGAEKVFHTSISDTAQPGTFVVLGENDPWMTSSPYEASKYHRAFTPALINAVLKAHPELHSMTLDYDGIYSKDLIEVKRYFRGRLIIKLHPLPAIGEAKAEAIGTIQTLESPQLSDIVQFTLLWSDNVLADRLARTATKAMGLGTDSTALQQGFEKVLGDLGVSTAGLHIIDGAGLSHETRISARTIADLLLKIKSDPDLEVIYDGLPVAGESGTLKDRFVKDAPRAVGLVKAKTGWIDTSVALAGYVDAGSKQYVFTVINDHVRPREYYRQLTREAIDKMLATIARPA